MGYTHYWEYKSSSGELSKDIWNNKFVPQVKMIMKLSGVPLGDTDGDRGSRPTITKDEISFNGIQPKDYEPFILRREKLKLPGLLSFGKFCKTGRRPYDKVVVAILMSAESCFGPTNFSWESDGDEDDHQEGKELFESAVSRHSSSKVLQLLLNEDDDDDDEEEEEEEEEEDDDDDDDDDDLLLPVVNGRVIRTEGLENLPSAVQQQIAWAQQAAAAARHQAQFQRMMPQRQPQVVFGGNQLFPDGLFGNNLFLGGGNQSLTISAPGSTTFPNPPPPPPPVAYSAPPPAPYGPLPGLMPPWAYYASAPGPVTTSSAYYTGAAPPITTARPVTSSTTPSMVSARPLVTPSSAPAACVPRPVITTSSSSTPEQLVTSASGMQNPSLRRAASLSLCDDETKPQLSAQPQRKKRKV